MKRGMFVVFEGADGVGKSTVMRLVVPELVRRRGLAGYLFFHWKPVRGNLSSDEIPADNPHDPRGARPRGALACTVFLAWHWLGFALGFLKHVRPALRAGRLVVADRYAYDVALDPRRFRLALPGWLLALFARTLPQPDVSVLLHADPAAVRARKPELAQEEIARYQEALLACRLVRNPAAVAADAAPHEVAAAVLARLEAPARETEDTCK